MCVVVSGCESEVISTWRSRIYTLPQLKHPQTMSAYCANYASATLLFPVLTLRCRTLRSHTTLILLPMQPRFCFHTSHFMPVMAASNPAMFPPVLLTRKRHSTQIYQLSDYFLHADPKLCSENVSRVLVSKSYFAAMKSDMSSSTPRAKTL